MSASRLMSAAKTGAGLFSILGLTVLVGCTTAPRQRSYLTWQAIPPRTATSTLDSNSVALETGEGGTSSHFIQSSDATLNFEPILPPIEAFENPHAYSHADESMLESVNPVETAKPLKVEEGVVSHYGKKWRGKTANGELFNPDTMTAAHKSLPFGTIVRVTRLDTLASVIVRINNRGPYIKGRIIDLAQQPARMLGLMDKGIAPCRVEVLEYPSRKR
jgi:rare lipoprotein A